MSLAHPYQHQRANILRNEADAMFTQSFMVGKIREFLARFTREPRALRSLDAFTPSDYTPTQLDHQDIAVSQIVGTGGCINRFDKDFHPLQAEDRLRWMSVAQGTMRDITQMPAINVVQVGDAYYVLDGHHRVSVARALNKLFIAANVTRWDAKA